MNVALDLAGRVEDVARGADGRLFLAKGTAFEAAQVFGEPFTDLPWLRRLWAAALERRLRLCREMGSTLVVLVAPEAHGVHADSLPAPLAYAKPSVADRFAELARAMGVTVVFPRDALVAARGPVEVFRRDDSHWTAFGAQLAYRALMDALPPALARGRDRGEPAAFAWNDALGDLAWSGETVQRRPCQRAVFQGGGARTVYERKNERRHGLTVCEVDDPSLPTAVIYRDSFGAELSPYLREAFRRSVFVGARERGYPELIAEERPDVVILERGERSLLCGVLDWGLETWREAFPDPGGDEAAHAAELAARAHLAAGNAATALSEAETAVAALPTIERTLLAGRAALAAGRVQAAVDMLETVVAEAPERWTGLMQLGIARLSAGEARTARDLFARACAVAPWNPGGFEHFGFAALQDGDAAGALAPLRTAVRLGPEAPGAHLWLVEALLRLGRVPEAEDAVGAALLHCPEDPLLQAHARGSAGSA